MDKIFEITLEDGTILHGNTLEDPCWKSLNLARKIKTLKVGLHEKDYISLEGYEKYNFYIGAKKLFNKTRPIVSHIYGLGCIGDTVTSYRITILPISDGKYKMGDVTLRKFPFGKEGMGRTATSGWKQGLIET